MKKFKIVNMKKFVRSISILLFIVLTIILLSSKVSFSHNENTQINYDTIKIIQGDTLWNIAIEQQKNNPYYENKDVRDIISHIRKVNKLSNCNLSIGQEVKIPTV